MEKPYSGYGKSIESVLRGHRVGVDIPLRGCYVAVVAAVLHGYGSAYHRYEWLVMLQIVSNCVE